MFALLLAASVTASATSPPEVAPAPRQRESKPVRVSRSIEYFGTVIAVDAKSITVKGTENGLATDEVLTRRFPASKALSEGKEEWTERGEGNYRLTDVQVGDRVYLRTLPIEEDDYCLTVKIERRPGGLVPPAPWQDPESEYPYHVKMRAQQASEEFGILLPPQFNPIVQAALMKESAERDEKILEAFRAKLKWEEEHTAPRPRPVLSPRIK